MLPSVKRARFPASQKSKPGKMKDSKDADVEIEIQKPQKAFQLHTPLKRVVDKDQRFALRYPDPPVEIFNHIGYTQRGAKDRVLAAGSVHPTQTDCTSTSDLNVATVVYNEATGWIERHCDIPTDFERPTRFGPLSGTTYSERVVQSYSLGLLRVREKLESKLPAYPAAIEELVDDGYEEDKSRLMLNCCQGRTSHAKLLLSS